MKKIFAFLMALMMVFGLAPMLNLAKTAEATEEWALVTWDQITTDDTFLIAVNKAGTAMRCRMLRLPSYFLSAQP